jgi:glycosyltransferase involved in cell wall biosynthesis
LVDATNGYLLPSGDADALYEAVRAFHRSGLQERMAMATASYERCLNGFAWPAVTRTFLDTFNEVIRSERRSA